MKKYFKILFVSLLVTLTIGKGALASSMVLTPAQHKYYLTNIKGCIARLMRIYDDSKKVTERERAESDMIGVVNHPETYPIVVQAFEEAEKEMRSLELGGVIIKKSWQNNFRVIRKVYIKR